MHLASATEELKGSIEAAWQFRKQVNLVDKFAASTRGYIEFYHYFLSFESHCISMTIKPIF